MKQVMKINLKIESIAIGNMAGMRNQGEYSIAIGNNAGYSDQKPFTIVLSANNNYALNTDFSNAFYVNPIRNINNNNNEILTYNSTSSEITRTKYLNINGLNITGDNISDNVLTISGDIVVRVL